MQDRLELFAVELQEEKFRLIQIYVWISAAIFTGMMAITFASLTLVYLFWESARLAVLGALTVAYAGVLIAIIVAFRRRRLSPFAQIAAVPLGFLVQRAVFPRRKILGSLLRWAPLVFSAVRGFKAAVTPARTESR